MAVGIALYLEDSRVNGIRPSHLDAIRLLCYAYGIESIAVIDSVEDGYFNNHGDDVVSYTRYPDVESWLAVETNQIVGLETEDRTLVAGQPSSNMLTGFVHPADNVTYLFGPAHGIPVNLITENQTWVHLPQAQTTGLEARDVITIVIAHRYLSLLGG